MVTTVIIWRFLSANAPNPYLVPIPVDLTLLLMLLGLFSAGGLHHLIGYTWGFYKILGRHSAWIGWPVLVLLIINVQVLLASYLVSYQAPRLAKTALQSPFAQAAIIPMGEALLEPGFALHSDKETVEKNQLTEALMSYPQDELTNLYGIALEKIENEYKIFLSQEPTALPLEEEPEKTPEETSAEKPEELSTAKPDAPEGKKPAEGPEQKETEKKGEAPPNPERKDPENKNPESTTPPKGEGKPVEPETTDEEEEVAEGPDAPLAPELLVLALRWGSRSEQIWPLPESDPEAKPLNKFLVNFLRELEEKVALSPKEWQMVTGTRFSTDVLEPLLVWHIRYTALLMVLFILVLNTGIFLVLRSFKKWLEKRRATKIDSLLESSDLLDL